MRSAFKGRFRSILAMIRDQSCLLRIAIESRMQVDHKDFKILVQNFLISLRFNQKLGLQRKNMAFYRTFHRENRGASYLLKDDSTSEIERFKGATIPQFSPHDFPPFFKGMKSIISGKSK